MQTEITNMNILYNDEHLNDLLETLDNLHSAASEGQLELMTAMSKHELIAMLREFVYTAQETIREIDDKREIRPVLRIVEKPLERQAQ